MKVSNIKPYALVQKDIVSLIYEEIEKVISSKFDSMPEWKKRILSKGYLIAMIIMFLTIIIGFIMYLIRSSLIGSFTNELKQQVGDFAIYKAAISATKLATPENTALISNKLHFNLRPSLVPPYAMIIRKTVGLKGETNKGTDFITNAVTFRWTERRGKERQVYYYTQGMLIIATDFFDDFEFNIQRETLLSKVFRREKLQLENDQFEKVFSIMQNNELILRQCFTPLIQENYIKYQKNVNLRNLKIIKTSNEVFITWETREDYLVVKNEKVMDASKDGIIKGILKNILKDVSELYTALAYVLSLPLFKEERSKKRELGQKENEDKIERSKLLKRMIKNMAMVEGNRK